MKKLYFALLAACVVALVADTASAQLFLDQMTDGTGWGVNTSGDTSAEFGYDYSADGIPEAPNSAGGDVATSGLKVTANNGDFIDAGEFQTLYPTGQSFTGDYELRFDAWMNYSTFDREQNGGAGTTEFLGGGIGYDNVSADVGSGAQTIVTNEGGSGSDYRAFANDGVNPTVFFDHVDMAALSRNNTSTDTAIYADLFPAGSGVAPAAQGQTGVPNENRLGAPGFQWFTYVFSVKGDIVRTQMINQDGLKKNIIVFDKTATPVTTDGNISLFYADFFSSITGNPQHTFGVIDNVSVTVPEPASLGLLGMGLIGLAMRRVR